MAAIFPEHEAFMRNFFFVLVLAVSAGGRAADAGEPILPIPAPPAQSAAKVALGDRLFHEPRLSRDDSVSCATCHPLAIGGSDALPFSRGVGGAEGTVNAPTVYNSDFNLAQFWDGRARDLVRQVPGPVHNPLEMASDWSEVLAKLKRDPTYPAAFAEVYADGMTAANIQDAIAAFERSLVTPDAAFDRWLRGDPGALNASELRGYELFKSYGCVACHQGVNVGGNLYQRMGAMGDYFADRGRPLEAADLGRYNVTQDKRDRHFFKVPSLRMAALTAPYFHDAGADSLAEAIRIMAKYQLGREMPAADVAAVEDFLHALVGRNPRLGP